ncbi:CGNR zinc finger domain-containing protein [Streptomyces sp. NPDC093970]|uniref:CGNR zinc finger domain-containing protein n=1 Tax=Streptomyces sp. NPDC093970 TaxID=3155076 RepID=UPI0034328658
MAGHDDMRAAAATIGLAGHPALELLNTGAILAPDTVTDLVGDGGRYVDWLAGVELVAPDDIGALRERCGEHDRERAAQAVRELRARLLPVVDAWVGGVHPDDGVTAYLNGLLRAGGTYREVARSATGLTVRERPAWTDWRSLVTPVAAAAADLLAHGNADLVHRCAGETCDLWFYDRTKSHRRRWCSMTTCGNRTKVRAHRARAAGHAGGTG